MERVVRIQSQQGGNFSRSNNLLDFNIPPGQYNFADSYLELMVSVPSVAPAGDGSTQVTQPTLFYANPGEATSGEYVPNSKWVKRSRLRSRNHGILEEIQDNDILRQNLAVYKKPTINQRDESHMSCCQIRDYNGAAESIFRDTRRGGEVGPTAATKTVVTKEISAPINVPMHEIIELGRMRNLPVDAMGGAMLNLELNCDVSDPDGTGGQWRVDAVSETFPTITPAFMAGDIPDTGTRNYGDWKDVTAAATPAPEKTLVTALAFADSADIPYYVGQLLNLSEAGGTGTATFDGTDRVIESILKNADNTLTVTFKTSLGTMGAGGQTWTQIETDTSLENSAGDATNTIIVQTANLVLKEIMRPVAVGGALSYTSWESERFSQSANSTLQQTFRLPGNCMNVIIAMPEDVVDYSRNTNLETYRLRVNNIDVTNRAVDVGGAGDANGKSAIHTQLLTSSFVQGNLGLMSLSETLIDATIETVEAQQVGMTGATGKQEQAMFLIAFPVNETADQKFLEVILKSSAVDITNIIVYKQVIRSIEL